MASVQKEGNSWTVRARINGRQKKFSPKTAGYPNSQKGARLFLAKLETELAQGTFCAPARTTVAEYAERWYDVYAKKHTSPKTQRSHDYAIRCYIRPGLGDITLTRLRPPQVEEFYSNLRGAGGQELAQWTKNSIHRTLNAILNHAVEMEVIPKNPIKAKIAPAAGKGRTVCYDLDQARRILEMLDGTFLHVPVALALHTGMRIGEICALKWDDVDLDAQTITITRSMEQTGHGIREKGTKTEKGRTIEIGDWLTQLLVRHRAEQARRRLSGSFSEFAGHVIGCHRKGGPHAPYHLATKWRHFVRGTDLPYYTFHTFRHTHCSLLIAQGEHVKMISARVGHSSSKITLDTYGHLMKGAGEKAVKKLDEAFGT